MAKITNWHFTDDSMRFVSLAPKIRWRKYYNGLLESNPYEYARLADFAHTAGFEPKLVGVRLIWNMSS